MLNQTLDSQLSLSKQTLLHLYENSMSVTLTSKSHPCIGMALRKTSVQLIMKSIKGFDNRAMFDF